jgi:sulfate adenylyltransferase
MPRSLIPPHGGRLIDLLIEDERAAELRKVSRDWMSIELTDRQVSDLELLVNGSFSPLTGYMGQRDYESVCRDVRLADGTVWPVPIVLDIPEALGRTLGVGESLALRDAEGVMLAALHVEEVWEPNRSRESALVYGTGDPGHPGVNYILNRTRPLYVSGSLEGLRLPVHYDFRLLRNTPAELRAEFTRQGWRQIAGFQTRNPMHRAHVELTRRAAADAEANLLIHPVVGMTKSGDVDHFTRVRAYQAVMSRYPRNTAKLSLLNLAMRMAGPRSALWHAIIRKNHGCTHFIVGRDHAGPGVDATGTAFYGPYDAQEVLAAYEGEIGVTMVPFKNMVYVEDRDQYMTDEEVPEGSRVLSISGTELRSRLTEGRAIPGWFTYPEVADELRKTHPHRAKQGFTVFFTGLSGSGKSTIANAVRVKLLEAGGRPVSLLDGDIVRTNLSSELGFSREHRDLNVRRIGFVASEITKNGGIALCAPIAPYDAVRKENRDLISPLGGFVLVHVSTPLDVCERRDRKGLYDKARAGLIKEFTGVSDPYEVPQDSDLTIDTSDITPEAAANMVMLHLEHVGFIGGKRNGH